MRFIDQLLTCYNYNLHILPRVTQYYLGIISVKLILHAVIGIYCYSLHFIRIPWCCIFSYENFSENGFILNNFRTMSNVALQD